MGIESSCPLGRANVIHCEEVIRMNRSQFHVPVGYGGGTQAALLLQHRREQLEDELLRFQRQQHESARQERRVQVRYGSISSLQKPAEG